MLELIFKVIFAILAIIGVVEIVRVILFRTLKAGKLMLMITLSGHDEQAEYILRSAIERAKWFNDNVQVVCLDNGMDSATREVCEMICADNPDVILCTPDEFQKFWMV